MESDITERVTAGCLGQKSVESSAVTFIWVAIVDRMKWRYDVRGYRYLHLDAGHVCQNLYLASESIQCGVCALAAFDDDEINQVLGLDGKQQFVIYVAPVGKK
jgi:SagB-type dehydrogenase family enzyme